MPYETEIEFNKDGTVLMDFHEKTETSYLYSLAREFDISSTRSSACDFPKKPYQGKLHAGHLEPTRKWFQDL